MANVFIFFRDYRIQDNVGLNKAMMFYEDIIPIFVFTPQQIEEKRNKYFSSNSVQFLCQSLEDLNDQIERKTSKSKGGKKQCRNCKKYYTCKHKHNCYNKTRRKSKKRNTKKRVKY